MYSVRLEVLGDGSQEKTYLDIEDTVDAVISIISSFPNGFTPINITSEATIQVRRVAEIIIDELGLHDVSTEYTGGKRGWPGDVMMTSLSVNKLKSFGWVPKYSIEESIRKMVKWLVQEYGPLS